MKEAGNKIISSISARRKDLLIMRKEMEAISNRLEIATDDGSLGCAGFPTDILRNIIKAKEKIDLVVAVGPVPMMKAISEVTKPVRIKTIVSLNPIMVDGTGMCGGCRVTVRGETKFTCVNGPEFDGHEVDFEELARRLAIYDEEKKVGKTNAESSPCILQTEALKKDSKGRIPRQKLAEQEPKNRIENFREVTSGYTPEQAFLEAKRCLQCKKPPCQEGCPVQVDIPAFIQLIVQGDYVGAARKIKEESCLPAVCGRVCPAEDNCEKSCVLGKKENPVAIGNLERFVADKERELSKIEAPPLPSLKKERVAVIGSGPSGISAAGDLVKLGYRVTLFEAFHKAGGVLVYGIPEFRLPKAIVETEVDYLRKLGVEIELNSVIGKLWTIEELFRKQGVKAVFVGTGAGLPRFLGIPGENFNGVLSANEYLTRTNLMKAYDSNYQTPILKRKRIAIIGGGNVAIDAARTALRLGGEEVTVVYRRSRLEMPARPNEVHHGEEEGLKFQFLTNPIKIIGNQEGWVKEMECLRMELGEPDESGRKRPIPIKGSEFILKVEMVIPAIGNGPHPLVPQTTPDLKIDKRGNIIADEKTGKTSKKGVFAGGDIVTGAATVISAMRAGRQAAQAIDKYLKG
jgi:glutamate synthase (NADPH/NADH) small chain